MPAKTAESAALGVVIPGYGHPRFLAEAIHSACNQICAAPVKVVVVDDGCRFVETAETVANLMEQYPGKLYYLRHPNTRLPGARNAGVRFLLEIAPDIDAIYFLDADNRIEPYSLNAFRKALGDDPGIGWAYPDISFFGQVWNAEGFDTRETAPCYSKLLHLVGNVSEAGSMVRADAFRAGVFYDDSMTSGFEDWEFWLSMLDAGYTGTPVHQAGFSYRRRPESMLVGSRRLEESLIAYIKQKHKGLYAPRTLMNLEHSDAPAFAVVCADTEDVFLFSDPLADCKALTLKEYTESVVEWYSAPREKFFADKILFLTSGQYRQLKDNPAYLRWLFWRIRGLKTDFTRISFAAAARMAAEGRPWGTPTVRDQFLCLTAEGLRALIDSGDLLEKISDLPAAHRLHVESPVALVENTSESDIDQLFQQVVELGRCNRNGKTRIRHIHRRYAGPNHSAIRSTLIEPAAAFDQQVPIPVTHLKPRLTIALDPAGVGNAPILEHVGKLVQAATASGVEVAIVQEYYREFNMDWREKIEWGNLITDIFPLMQRSNNEEFSMYLGRRISARLPMTSKAEMSTIGRMSDTLMCIGAAGSMEALGEVRSQGVKTAVWLEPFFEGTLEGESFAKMLAFEHGIDFVVSDDVVVSSRLSAQGVPPGKIINPETFFSRELVPVGRHQ